MSCRSAAILAAALTALPAAAAAADSRHSGACAAHGETVVVDVGHGHARPGTTSAHGKPEFDFNRALARTIAAHLRRDGRRRVVLINSDGADLTLSDRVAAINRAGGQLLISVHHDSVQPVYLENWQVDGAAQTYTRHARGYSLFVSDRNPRAEDSRSLAASIGTALRAAGLAPSTHHGEPIAGENRTVVDERLGIYRFDGLAVLKGSRVPAVLIEAAVIKHPDDEAAAATDAFRATVADAVVNAIRALCLTPVDD